MVESEHFKVSELSCRCGCGQDALTAGVVSERQYRAWLALLEKVRARYGQPIHLNSAYRCPRHNAAVGGVPGSQHTVGLAVDVATRGAEDMAALADAARVSGVMAIGVGKGFLHFDWRTGADRLWGY